MNLYRIEYNDFGIAYIKANSFENAVLMFGDWYRKKFPEEKNPTGKYQNPIKKVEILVGEAL